MADRRRAERFGRLAETATALLFALRGYRTLARRARTPVGEVDLVARRGRTIVFVEVKLRERLDAGLESVTPRGRRRIVDAASWWLAANPDFVSYTLRFDVVVWTPWALPRHLAAAFDAGR